MVSRGLRSGRSAYSLRRSRLSDSTARRSSASLRAPGVLRPLSRGRRRPARHTFLVTHAPLQGTSPRSHRRRVRAMPATAVEGRPRNVEPATLLSFLALQRFRNQGSADRGDRCPRHVPASAFPTPSPAYSPWDLSSIFQPVTLLGFGLQGFCSSRRAGDPLGPPLLSCRSPRVVRSLDRSPPGSAPEYSLRESVPCGARFYPHRPAVTLLAFSPLGHSLSTP